ncbi:glycoside hydrolase family 128 protein [Amniculicola lignicola CBS 123094]|uniref:Glycoside hydrolase family 128 protein n=1 Tax=Amniculicola lignicola CBS 123094 TaxID=1392246 RepID=A0A6A5WIE7_9PLEO|nr:glycoside hydrolase family 128 protein [Amniculicola lignicola CBS 123094]
MWHSRSLHAVAAAVLTTLPLILATSSPKRGLCHVPSKKYPSDDKVWVNTPGSDLTWYYNYGASPSAAYRNTDLQFVPMLWGASTNDTGTIFLDTVTDLINGGTNITHVLAFNEPDGTTATGGADISPSVAAAAWIRQIEPLKDLGVKLGAPSVTGSSRGFTWLENWLKACNGGCNPDFNPVHWYGNFEGMASHIGQMMGTYPNQTVWVTEWGYANQGLEETQAFYNISTQWFDRMESITHYSYFGAFRSDVSNVGPNSAMLTQSGKLTDIGSWYLGGASTNNVPNGDAAQIAKFCGWVFVVLAVGVWVVL